jgi:predicted GNAT family acetyltransferase
MTNAGEIQIEDRPNAGRYEIYFNGKRAGLAAYELADQRIVFTHTEIDDAYEGHGLGGRLVGYALDDARRRGLTVVPRCPFVRRYIEEHPEYADLVSA